MTEQEQRIAIAEACGFKRIHSDGPPDNTLFGYKVGDEPDCDPVNIPNYLNDLNAMASAEDTLSDEQWDLYSTWLCITTDYKTSRLRAHELIRAKAHERAEAFLRTLDKWK